MHRATATGLVLALLVPSGAFAAEAAPSPPEPAELTRRLDAWARPFADAGHLSGTLLVARDDVVVYERSFGMASYELSAPNTPTTLFSVASVAKPLTGIVALQLLAEEALRPADPVSRWIPGFPRGDQLTVEHLLQHRSGLPHRVTTDAEETVPHTAEDMAAFAARADLLFAPGTADQYSSAGYSVLSRVLELASGRPFPELLVERVFAPAGAVHSLHADSRRLVPGRAESYLLTGSGLVNDPLRDLSFLVGAGSVLSTPRDLFAVLARLRSGGYGDTVRQGLEREGGRYGWNGWTDGFRAFVDYHAAEELTVIFAGNLRTGAVDRLREAVPRLAAGEDPGPPVVPASTPDPVPADRRPALEGVYQLRPPAPDSEEELRFVGPGGADLELGGWPLIAVGEDRLFSPSDYAVVRIVRRDDGSVEALAWEIPGGELRFPRVRELASR
jgi:CubicO group peptidase (beta-lactamase class C family)